jgi:hypothetical protein
MITAPVMMGLILMLAMIASGGIGFWIGREKYRGSSGKYGGHRPLPDGPAPRAKMAATI